MESLALILLYFPLCVTPHPAIASPVSFESQPICPTDADKPGLGSILGVASSAAACIVECATRGGNCSAVHFNQTSGSCWTAASRLQWQDRWTNRGTGDDCVTFAKLPTATWQLSSSLLASLVMWYDFRYSLSNLVGNATAGTSYTGQLNLGAVRNASGAVLNASTQSHVAIIVTDGFESKFGSGGKFSVYAKVQRRPRDQDVNYLQTVTSGKSVTYLIEGATGQFTVGCRIYQQKQQITVETLLPTPVTAGVVSVGFQFDGSAFRVFYNGSLHATANSGILPAAGAATSVIIGSREGDASKTLDGRVMCFGLTDRDLSATEFTELEGVC